MIDTKKEQLLTLAEVANLLPRRRAGRKTSLSCVYRWTTAGCRGVRLEFTQVGGTRCTSRDALARFFEKLSAVQKRPSDAAGNADPGRAKRLELADQELSAEGV
jgi:hypothetical protein